MIVFLSLGISIMKDCSSFVEFIGQKNFLMLKLIPKQKHSLRRNKLLVLTKYTQFSIVENHNLGQTTIFRHTLQTSLFHEIAKACYLYRWFVVQAKKKINPIFIQFHPFLWRYIRFTIKKWQT